MNSGDKFMGPGHKGSPAALAKDGLFFLEVRHERRTYLEYLVGGPFFKSI